MQFGVNCDPRHWDDLDELSTRIASTGCTHVRTVAKPHPDDLAPWINACHAHGLKVLLVFARESFPGWSPRWSRARFVYWVEQYHAQYGELADAIQFGNESNWKGDSSWSMNPASLEEGLVTFREIFANTLLVGPGLMANRPPYLFRTELVDREARHVYVPQEHLTLERPASGKGLWITEYPTEEGMARCLRERWPWIEVAFAFCWSDRMVPGYGIVDADDREKWPQWGEFVDSCTAAKLRREIQEEITMAGLNVGQGLWDYVIAQDDRPLKDSEFVDNLNGTKFERTIGAKGVYVASNATGENGEPGEWTCAGPFGDGAEA